MEEAIMTKYEYTRVRGIRIQQLIDGMQAFVDIEDGDREEDTFKKELLEKKIPLKITRPNGFNTFVDIAVSDMNVERFL
jgi:DNA-directed RNA polymerase subunit K/omega